MASAETERDLLRVCHASPDIETLMDGLIACLSAATGIEAVGIRLSDGDDYPYYTTRGFPREFVLAESSLCSRDGQGEIERDAAGNAVLACMCGNVLCGRFDPSRSFFTSAGTFWTGSTSELLATTTEADRQARTRNRCNGEGYESVALVPLRTAGRTFGLVQFNDRRPGLFEPAVIAELEHLVAHIALAVAKFDAEEKLRRSEERYRIVADQTHDWEFWTRADGRIVYMSPSCERLTGYTVDEFMADPGLRRKIVVPADLESWDRHREQCHVGAVLGSAEFRIVRKDGRQRWIHHVCRPILSQDGTSVGVRGSNRDITDRHEAEEARDAALAVQRQLVVELQEALARVKTLHGLIPICAGCKKIRDDEGYWQAVEVYVGKRTNAEFSHGLCPACAQRLYPGLTADDTSRRSEGS